MLPLPAKASTEEKTNTCKDQCLMTRAYGGELDLWTLQQIMIRGYSPLTLFIYHAYWPRRLHMTTSSRNRHFLKYYNYQASLWPWLWKEQSFFIFFKLYDTPPQNDAPPHSLVTKGWAVQKISSGQGHDRGTQGHGDFSHPTPLHPRIMIHFPSCIDIRLHNLIMQYAMPHVHALIDRKAIVGDCWLADASDEETAGQHYCCPVEAKAKEQKL